MVHGERLPSDPLERELIAIYETAAARVALQLDTALASEQVGTARYRRTRLTVIGDILAGLRAPTRQLVPALVGASYTAAAARVDQLIRATDAFGGGIHDQAIRVLADNLTSQLDAARQTIGRRAEDAIRKAGLRQVAIGLAGGDTRRAVSSRLRDELASQGMTSFQDALGRRWKLDTYAAMAVRTTTREAVTAGTENRLLERGLDLVTVSSHPGPADICEPYEGKTFSLTGKTPGFDRLDARPPFHPNCKHVLTPARENLDLVEQQLGLIA